MADTVMTPAVSEGAATTIHRTDAVLARIRERWGEPKENSLEPCNVCGAKVQIVAGRLTRTCNYAIHAQQRADDRATAPLSVSPKEAVESIRRASDESEDWWQR